MENTQTVISSEKRAKAAVVMVYLATIGFAIFKLLVIFEKLFFEENLEFELPMPQAAGSYSNLILTIDILAIVETSIFVIFIVSGLTFIMWFWRAYSNLHALGCDSLYHRGWTIGCWFIPIGNLYLPYKIMQTMFDGINRMLMKKEALFQNTTRASGKNIGTWWALCIIYGIADRFGLKGFIGSSSFGESFSAIMAIVLVVLLLLAANYAVQLIEEYTRAENVLLNEEEETVL